MVIYIHTGNLGRNLYALTEAPLLRYAYYVLAVIAETGVPLFFAVSGALLLGKQEPIRDILRKRVTRIVIILVLISACHYVYNYATGDYDFISIADFLKRLLSNDITGSMWFLYVYCMYLLILPFLRMLVRQMKDADYKYLFGFYLIAKGVIAIVISALNLTLEMDVYDSPLFANVIIYPLIGYYVAHVMTAESCKKRNIIYLLLYIIAACLAAVMSYHMGVARDEFSQYRNGLFSSALTGLMVYIIFYFARVLFENEKADTKAGTIICTLGQCTFGVYLIERFVRERLFGMYDALMPYLTRIGAAFVMVIVTWTVATAIVWCARKVPVVRKYT